MNGNANANAADTHVSAVILDLDGTLLNTEVLNKDVLKDYLEGYGKVVDQKKEDMRSGMSHHEFRLAIIKEYDLLITPEQFTEEIRPMYRERWLLARALPGANRLIKHLHNQKVPFALASNSLTRNVEAKVSHQPGWTKYFPIVLGSDQVKSGKPSPDIFLEAANRMGVNVASCLVIEDSLIGVKAAKAAGMKVVAVPSLQSESDQFSIADMVLHTLLDLQPEVWGLPPFEDWVSGVVPIEPVHVRGLYKNGFLHELEGHGASALPDQVVGVYFGWAQFESPKILKILMSITWERNCCCLEKVIHVCPIDESGEANCDQKMQVMLVGYIGGHNKEKSSSENKILEEDKVLAMTALKSSAFTHHSCMPSF
ncbi:bifunctional riboflavin kinase/FMN phosphatase [Daucus carota subsp. sativus]|uniref:bifunctional riboflavin kinase/FMN phosphatase n=1 Tax=Daucus carota subsp. sativus TaxID=79200 RepID=UPI0007B2886F|nr:PREDICTED: bifunctional riboflavin kinase/FMN phosphatase-like [Daucus carota subsp. sativus]